MTNKRLFPAVVAAVLMAGGQVHAGTCPADTTVTTVEAAGFSCTLGTMTFSNFTISGAPSSAVVGFGQLGPLFAVTLARDGAFFPTGATVFDFTVAAAAPNTIRMGTVGVDVSFPNVITITSMNGMSLTPSSITNGGTGMITFSPGVSSITVADTSHIIGSTAELNSLTNDFSPVMIGVAEPSSLALFGLGLAGLALFARRPRS
jgi:hypothetical protein